MVHESSRSGWLADAHVHLDSYADREGVIRRAVENRVHLFAVTNRASEFRNLASAFSPDEVTIGLGLHPEMAGSVYEKHELAIFARMHDRTSLIAEVGLDGVIASQVSPHFGSVPLMSAQLNLLDTILSLGVSGKVLSVHSRGAEEEVCARLISADVEAAVFHWYHGSLDQVRRGMDRGYMFSVNPAMCEDDSQRRLVQQMPAEHLLLETDGPFTSWAGRIAEPGDLPNFINRVAEIRGEAADALHAKVSANLERLKNSARPKGGGSGAV